MTLNCLMTGNGTRNNIHEENVYTLKRLSDNSRNQKVCAFLSHEAFLAVLAVVFDNTNMLTCHLGSYCPI
jgi:hypothetical protein